MSEHQAEHRHGTTGKDRGECGYGVGTTASSAPGTMVIDPVCGMKIDPARSKYHYDHGGKTFHFCSAGCQAKCSGLHLSAVGRDLIGLNRLTLAGIIGCVWLTLGGLLATLDDSGLEPQGAP